MNKIKYRCVFILAIVLVTLSAKAQDWKIPEDSKTMSNPLEITSELKDKGFDLYSKNCQSCHGEVGKANFIALTPPPGDLGAESFKAANPPGVIFYKMTTGKVTMPSFKATLSEDDRWAIVAYLNPVGGDAIVEESGADAKEVKLNISTNDKSKKIIVSLTGKNNEGELVKVSNTKVEVYAKRTFGNLLLGKGKTNSSGAFSLEFPTDLPGDTLGNVSVIVKVPDNKLEKSLQINWGVETHPKNITDEASIWGTNAKAPWWIILLYVGIAGLVWSVIVYIVFQILKIVKLGKKSK